jgi:nucleoside-diphosphate-sugar epimerase
MQLGSYMCHRSSNARSTTSTRRSCAAPDAQAPLLYALCRTSAHIDLIAGLGMVDLDDVAAAHVLATVLPEARGRYVLCERFALMSEMAGMMR